MSIPVEVFLELHSIVISETGGSDRLRDLGRLDQAVAAQIQNVFGQETYGTLFEKSAAMMRGIIVDHPFVDGNKRTAVISALTFLYINGLKFYAIAVEIEDFAVRFATDHLEITMTASWLEHHCKQS